MAHPDSLGGDGGRTRGAAEGALSGAPAAVFRALGAPVLPALLLAASIAGIALPIAGWPKRLLLNLLPFVVVYAACWWALGRIASPAVKGILLALLALLCVPAAYSDNRTARTPQFSRMDSPALWSVTLQNPRQAIMVQLTLPSPPAPQVLVVWLESAYHGSAMLRATVNGVGLGTLRPRPFAGSSDVDRRELVAHVSADVLSSKPVVEILLEQDRPDASLRIVTFGRPASPTVPERTPWFFDGERWHNGVVEARSGRVVPGMPAILLEPAP